MEPEDIPAPEPFTPIEIRCYFVRKRNCLAVRGQFAPLFVDYYLHLASNHLQVTQFQDGVIKDGLAAITLHLASRPWNEHHAWTLHFQHPMVNLFLVGDNAASKVVGRTFDRDVKDAKKNLFFSQVMHANQTEPRTSAVEFTGNNVFRALEQFYEQSEQRQGRLFDYGDEDYVLIVAQPDVDQAWLENLTVEDVREMDKQEELSLLETRTYHFECGCSEQRIWEVLAPHCAGGAADLFEEAEQVQVSCRRCGAQYRILREQFEAYLESRTKVGE